MTTRRQSILVAENNRAIAQALRVHLERAGFTVIVTLDGDQAAILAARQRFDLILVNLELPIMSGRDFCRHLREDLLLTEIPLGVFASPSLKPESNDVIFLHDIARVFHKPIDPAEVVQFAKKVIGQTVTA
jgi:DNA-binding response OmpR family regulator